MKMVIRNRATRAFLAKEGGWTDDVTSALPLEDEQQAILVKHHLKLDNIDLYYRYFEDRNTVWDFAVRLQ